MPTLDSLETGQEAQICEVVGDDPVTVRLLEMGLLPGERVEMIGVAPLGDPIAILVRGSRLALRRRDARRVRITTTSAGTIPQSASPPVISLAVRS
jgi:ferrous iron transport protein A